MWQQWQEPTAKPLTTVWKVRKISCKYAVVSGADLKLYLSSVYHRIFYGKPDENTQIYDSNTYVREYTYLGFAEEIDERGLARLTQRNKFSVGETIEIMKPDGRNIPVTVEAIYNEEGEAMESAPHAQQRIYVKLTEMPEVFDILRRGE